MNTKKSAILDFMRSYEPYGVCEGYVHDHMTGKDVSGLVDYSCEAGDLIWFNSDIYNFERYDMELNPEFCARVLELVEAVE